VTHLESMRVFIIGHRGVLGRDFVQILGRVQGYAIVGVYFFQKWTSRTDVDDAGVPHVQQFDRIRLMETLNC